MCCVYVAIYCNNSHLCYVVTNCKFNVVTPRSSSYMCCVAIACDSSRLCYVVRPCKINVVIPHSSSYMCCASDFVAWLFSCSRFPWLFRNMCPHSPRLFRIMCFVVTALSCPATLVTSPHPLVVQKYASSQSMAVQKPLVVPKDVLCRHSPWLFRNMCCHSPWLFRNMYCVATASGCSETCVVTASGCLETCVVSSQPLVIQKQMCRHRPWLFRNVFCDAVQKHVLCHHITWLVTTPGCSEGVVSAPALVVQKHMLCRHSAWSGEGSTCTRHQQQLHGGDFAVGVSTHTSAQHVYHWLCCQGSANGI